jgi:hypothetical protein
MPLRVAVLAGRETTARCRFRRGQGLPKSRSPASGFCSRTQASPLKCWQMRQERLVAVVDGGLPLAIVAESGDFEDGRGNSAALATWRRSCSLRIAEGGPCGKPLSRRKDFSAMRFWQTATAAADGRTGTNLAEIIERVGRHVLEFGGDRRTALGEFIERQHNRRNLRGKCLSATCPAGLCGIRVEDPDLVAQFMRGADEVAAELAAA